MEMKDPREPYTFQENLEYERSIDMTHWGMDPDTSPGSYVGCFCNDCQEARLRDDERMVYTARDVAEAYRRGYEDALARVIGKLRDMGTSGDDRDSRNATAGPHRRLVPHP